MTRTVLLALLFTPLVLPACSGGTYGDATIHWAGGERVELATGAVASGPLGSGMRQSSFWWHDSDVLVTDDTATASPAGVVEVTRGWNGWSVKAKAPGAATVTFEGKVDGTKATTTVAVRVADPVTFDVVLPRGSRPAALIAGGTYDLDVVARDAGGTRLITSGLVPSFLGAAVPLEGPPADGTVSLTATAPITLPDGGVIDLVQAPDALDFVPNGAMPDWARGHGWIGVKMLHTGREIPFPTHGFIGTAKLTLTSDDCGFSACVTCDHLRADRSDLVTLPNLLVGAVAGAEGSCSMEVEATVGGGQWTLPLTVPLAELPPHKPVPPTAPAGP